MGLISNYTPPVTAGPSRYAKESGELLAAGPGAAYDIVVQKGNSEEDTKRAVDTTVRHFQKSVYAHDASKTAKAVDKKTDAKTGAVTVFFMIAEKGERKTADKTDAADGAPEVNEDELVGPSA